MKLSYSEKFEDFLTSKWHPANAIIGQFKIGPIRTALPYINKGCSRRGDRGKISQSSWKNFHDDFPSSDAPRER